MSASNKDIEDRKRVIRLGLDYLERFVDDKTGKINVTKMRLALEKAETDNAALRALLAECRPSMVEYRKRVEQGLTNAAYFPGLYPETLKALNTERDICDALLDRIGAAVKS